MTENSSIKNYGSMQKKEQKMDLSKVNKTSVKVAQPSKIQKFKDTFIAQDLHTVTSYVWEYTVVPYIKGAIVNAGKSFIENLIMGTSSTPTQHTTQTNYYNRYSSISSIDYTGRSRPIQTSPQPRGEQYRELTFATEEEAKYVLNQLNDQIEVYGKACAGAMYDELGITVPFTYNDYGWRDLRAAKIEKRLSPDGVIRFALVLPRLVYIRN